MHVLHIVDTSIANRLKEFWGCRRALIGSQEAVEKIRDSALTQLKELVSRSEPQDGSVDMDAMTGTPFLELLRRVRDNSADLLVLGSNGSSDPSNGAGVLATKCVRKAATKVLLVRADHAGPFQNVVVCVDFSESSHRVIEQAIRVAQQDGASLRLALFTPICSNPRTCFFATSDFPAGRRTRRSSRSNPYRDARGQGFSHECESRLRQRVFPFG